VVGRVSERVAGHYVYGVKVAVVVKYLNLALLKMGISLPETC
jgi:hypothetical protein